MALAQKIDAYSRTVEGSAARALPSDDRAVRTESRPAPKPKKQVSRKLIAAGAAGWLGVMGFAMALVYTSTQIQGQTAAITKLRAELSVQEVANRDLANRLETQVSVEKVQGWATAHQMARPTVINQLKGTPTAVAAKPEPAAPPQVQPGAVSSLWSTLKSYFTGAISSAKR
jgi:hypothetical protein